MCLLSPGASSKFTVLWLFRLSGIFLNSRVYFALSSLWSPRNKSYRHHFISLVSHLLPLSQDLLSVCSKVLSMSYYSLETQWSQLSSTGSRASKGSTFLSLNHQVMGQRRQDTIYPSRRQETHLFGVLLFPYYFIMKFFYIIKNKIYFLIIKITLGYLGWACLAFILPTKNQTYSGGRR